MKKYDSDNDKMREAVFAYAEENENKCNVAETYLNICGALGGIDEDSFAKQSNVFVAAEVSSDLFTLRDKVGAIIWRMINKRKPK